MLKIRENVDLEELKKFGFKKDKFLGYVLLEEVNENWQKILVMINNERIIKLNYGSTEETIQDLIKADLVVEVEE